METKQSSVSVARNLALAGMVSQIGCITVVIVIAALLGGMALDRSLGTRPIMMVACLVLSVPVSVYSLARVALATAAQFQVASGGAPVASKDSLNADEKQDESLDGE